MALANETVARLLVREHDRLRAYTWLLVRDDHLVDDVLQEVALIVVRRREEIADEDHFMGFVRTACRNVAMDLVRQNRRRPVILDNAVLDLLDAEWQEHDRESMSDVVDALRHCIERLSPYARQIIEMRYRGGLTSSELAAKLQRRATTIYVALTRAHRALAKCIENRLHGEEDGDG